jgi:hypothetical protein
MLNKKFLLHSIILPVVSAWGITVAMSSCNASDSPDDLSQKSDSVEITFTVNTGDDITRAVSGFDVGAGLENYIDVNKLRVFFSNYKFSSSKYGSALTEFAVDEVERISTTTYYIHGKIAETDIPAGDFRVVVGANWEVQTYTSAQTNNIGYLCITEAAGYKYLYGSASDTGAGFVLDEDHLLPMYGIKEYESGTVDFVQGKEANLGQINLVRGMAKIVVKPSTPTEFSNVMVTKMWNKGMSAPCEMYQNTSQPAANQLNIPREQTSATVKPDLITDVPFTQQDDGSWVLYVPEYRNTGSNSNVPVSVSQIKLTKDGVDYFLDFKNYDTDVAFDLMRNNIYIYQIAGATINYTVVDWGNYTSGDINFD